MRNFLKNVFSKGELRRKIVFTLGILFVYRLGAAITIPSVNIGSINTSSEGLFGILNMIGGGTLERFSIFALGVSPYITSSIIVELLSMDVIPVLTQWSKEGNTGKKKKDQVTRYVTLALSLLQGFVLTYAFDRGYGIIDNPTMWSYIYVVVIMTGGSMFAVWLGDQISNKGIGNGVSLLIFTGIVSNLPTSFITTFNSIVTEGSSFTLDLIWYILFVIVYVAIIVFVVFNEGSQRKIPIVYASSTNTVMRTREQTHMPIKINSSGVIPVIFAASVMAAPRTVISFMESNSVTKIIDTICNYQQPVGFVLYILMIAFFTFFYSNLQIDSEKISKDLRKNGGSIPGVRTGEDTRWYLYRVINQVTVVGALFLIIIAAIPVITPVIWEQTANAQVSLGGTGLIIVTSVALETIRQIKTQVTRKEYHGYIRK